MAFSALIVVGGITLTVSAAFGIFWLGLIGRCLCGVGVECQNVTFYAFYKRDKLQPDDKW